MGWVKVQKQGNPEVLNFQCLAFSVENKFIPVPCTRFSRTVLKHIFLNAGAALTKKVALIKGLSSASALLNGLAYGGRGLCNRSLGCRIQKGYSQVGGCTRARELDAAGGRRRGLAPLVRHDILELEHTRVPLKTCVEHPPQCRELGAVDNLIGPLGETLKLRNELLNSLIGSLLGQHRGRDQECSRVTKRILKLSSARPRAQHLHLYTSFSSTKLRHYVFGTILCPDDNLVLGRELGPLQTVRKSIDVSDHVLVREAAHAHHSKWDTGEER